MQKGFWGELPKPFYVLAPMHDVTDTVFRQMTQKYSGDNCHVMFTEFVSCDGICSEGRKAIMPLLSFDESERPVVAQFFGSKPENFYESAKLVRELGFDGIDINMGCPDKNIEKQGAGAKLMIDPELAKKIIRETKRGAGDLPVSVKTRLGYKENNIKKWIKHLLEEKPAVISIHGRTRKGLYVEPADWSAIAEAVEIAKDSETLIVGNGDIKSMADAKEKIKMSGVDGVMVGRAVFGNPWFFAPTDSKNLPRENSTRTPASLKERLKVLLEHARLFEKTYGNKRNFSMLKKHFKSYTTGFKGSKKLREKLMQTKNADEVERVIENQYFTPPK